MRSFKINKKNSIYLSLQHAEHLCSNKIAKKRIFLEFSNFFIAKIIFCFYQGIDFWFFKNNPLFKNTQLIELDTYNILKYYFYKVVREKWKYHFVGFSRNFISIMSAICGVKFLILQTMLLLKFLDLPCISAAMAIVYFQVNLSYSILKEKIRFDFVFAYVISLNHIGYWLRRNRTLKLFLFTIFKTFFSYSYFFFPEQTYFSLLFYILNLFLFFFQIFFILFNQKDAFFPVI